MQLNKFKLVNIPTTRQLFSRFGDRVKQGRYSVSLSDIDAGVEIETVSMTGNKLSQVQQVRAYIQKEVAATDK